MEEDNNVDDSKVGSALLLIGMALFAITLIGIFTDTIISDTTTEWMTSIASLIWVVGCIMMYVDSTVKENRAKMVQELKAELQKDQAALRND